MDTPVNLPHQEPKKNIYPTVSKTPSEIITELYDSNFVPYHIKKLSRHGINDYDADDLEQYIYNYLLEHADKLVEVYEKGNINYYVLLMIKQQIKSKNSWFARTIRTKDEKQPKLNEGIHTPRQLGHLHQV